MSEIILGNIADLGRPIKKATSTTDMATAIKMNCAVMDVYLFKREEADKSLHYLKNIPLGSLIEAREFLDACSRKQKITEGVEIAGVMTDAQIAAVFTLLKYDPTGKDGFTLITAGGGKALCIVKGLEANEK